MGNWGSVGTGTLAWLAFLLHVPVVDAAGPESYILSGQILHRHELAPGLNGTGVPGALVRIERKVGDSWVHHAQMTTQGQGLFWFDFSSAVPPGQSATFRAKLSKPGYAFGTADGWSFDQFVIPRPHVPRKIIGNAHYFGLYGLGGLDDLAKAPSPKDSILGFLDFTIPRLSVPNALFSERTLNGKTYSLDRWRSNDEIVAAIQKVGNSGILTIVNAGFYREFSEERNDPQCSWKDALTGETLPASRRRQRIMGMHTVGPTWYWSAPQCGVQTKMAEFGKMFGILRSAPVAAYSIEEETIYHLPKKTDFLRAIYNTLKSLYPELTLYQWYTSHTKSNAPGDRPSANGPVVPGIPADSWIWDQYSMDFAGQLDEHGNVMPTQDEYLAYVPKMLALGSQPISIVWAGPNWNPGKGQAFEDPTLAPDCGFWEREGWKRFYQQVALNRNHMIPTAFSLQAVAERCQVVNGAERCSYFIDYIWRIPAKEKKYLSPTVWINPDPGLDKFFKTFSTTTVEQIRKRMSIPVGIPQDRPWWIPGYSCF